MNYDEPHYENIDVEQSQRRPQIAVLGSSKVVCTDSMYNHAFECGVEIAKRGGVTLTGGGHGVMEAALRGAKHEGGATMAIVPWEDKNNVNDYADYVVATGIGWSRNSININSVDGCIVVGGGAGTLNEATYAYMMRKPTVAIQTSGGIAEEIHDSFFDVRKTELIFGADDAAEAVSTIFKQIMQNGDEENNPSEYDMRLQKKIEKDKAAKEHLE